MTGDHQRTQMNENIHVFISGTHSDLKKERKAVRKVLAHFQLAVISMETFGSHAMPSLEAAK